MMHVLISILYLNTVDILYIVYKCFRFDFGVVKVRQTINVLDLIYGIYLKLNLLLITTSFI